MNRAEPHIIADLTRKVTGDVSRAFELPAALLEHPADHFALALAATATALGHTLGTAETAGLVAPDKEAWADGLWRNVFKPMALGALRNERPETILGRMMRDGVVK